MNVFRKILLSLAVVSLPSFAVTYESHFNIIYPENKSTSVRIFNESEKRAHVVSVDVWEIKDPKTREPITSSDRNDIVFTPATQLINPGKEAFFKFIYNGSEDGKERYYSIRWRDVALTKAGIVAKGEEYRAMSKATVNTSVVTTLIVNPRKSNKHFIKENGKIKNIGNTMVDVFINARCKIDKEKDCSTHGPFFPGQELDVSLMSQGDDLSMGYWLDNREAKMVDVSG